MNILKISLPFIVISQIEGRPMCSDYCGSEREKVDDNNIQEKVLKYIDQGEEKAIKCLDTSNITNMQGLLSGSIYVGGDERFRSFNTDLSCWDVSKVADMKYMFDSASDFNKDLSSWDVSSVTTMWSMFYYASAFNNNISSWDVSSVSNIQVMFAYASAFNNNISSWDVSSVT